MTSSSVIEYRLRREDIEERFNKEVQQGWRFAADAPSLSDENAGSVDCKCTSGGVSLIEIVFGAVVDKKKERSRLFLGHEGFAVYLWHSDGGTPRQEALMVVVVKQARTTRHLWLVACDVTFGPTDIECGLWFKEKCTFMEPPEAIVTICRATGSNGEFLERTYYYERVSKSLQGDIETTDMRLFSGGHET